MSGPTTSMGAGASGSIIPRFSLGLKTSRIISPTDERIQQVFSQLATRFQLRPQDERALTQGVVRQREQVGFDLIERESKKLEKCSTMSSPAEVKNYMIKLGYAPVRATIVDETGTSHNYTLYSKQTPQLIYAMEAELVKDQILPKMRSPTRFTDDKWLFNYQEKLCASVLREGQKFYYSNARVGLVIRCSSKNFLETFPLDKLTPTGFRKPTRLPSDTAGIAEDADDVAAVKKYAKFFEGYQEIVAYSDSILRNILSFAINSDNHQASEEAYRLIASYDQLSLEMEKNPLETKFLSASMLTLKIEALKKFAEKYKTLIDTPENCSKIFENPSTSSIQPEIDALLQLSKNFDSQHAQYHNVILHKKASELGPKWGHPDVNAGTTAYLSGRLMGISSLKRLPDNPLYSYNEINIKIPKNESTGQQIPGSIEIAAIKLDPDNFESDSTGTLSLNVRTLQAELAAVNTQYDQVNRDFQDIRSRLTPLSSAPASDRLTYSDLEQREKNLRITKLELTSKLSTCKILEEAERKNIPMLV